MKKKTKKWISFVLVFAMELMQVSPAWANAPANGNNGNSNGTGPDTNPEGKKGEPVDTKTGSNFFTEDDLSFNTPGVPLVFSRQYNSIETYDSPLGVGWSHSMDWRLHEAREIICKVVPPVTNANFKVNLWEGTQLLADGQVDTNGVCQTNVLTIIPTFLFGAPIKEPVDAYVEQPGGGYSVDLDDNAVSGAIGGANPDPISSLEDMDGNALPTNGVSYATNTWMEVYQGSGNTTRFWDYNTNGTYYASDKNWKIVADGGNWVLHLPGGIQRVFNGDGRMIRYQDGWGKGITFTYSGGLLQSATHDNGRGMNFYYSGNHLSSVGAGLGLSLSFTYTNGLLETVTRNVRIAGVQQQHLRSYEYTDGILTKRTNPAGHEYTYGYEEDEGGTLTHKANASSVDAEKWLEQSLVYRSETLTDFISHSRGLDLLERMAYSSKTGKLTDNFGPGIGETDAETRGIHYEYSGEDQIEAKKFDDNVGETFSTFTEYAGRHNPVRTAVAYNTTNQTEIATTTWNQEFMLPASIADAEGNRSEMVYQNGSLKTLRQFYAVSNSYDTAYGYTANGLLSSETNANNHAVQYTYDSNGYPETVVPAAGPVVSTDYDLYGNLHTLEILPEGGGTGTGRITTFNFNALGWLDSRIDADGLGVTNQYNGLGYLTNTVDRAGRATDYTYAPTRKLTSVTQYLEQGGTNAPVRITYDYDQWFNTVTITEPRDRYVESYQLDTQDRVTSVTNIENQAMSIEYGVGEFVHKITRFDGSTITNEYDGAGRKTAAIYRTAGGSPAATISRDYYADGQLKTVSDGFSSVTNSFDRLNRLTNVVFAVGNSMFEIRYSHDPVGNLTNSVLSGSLSADNLATAYSYDAAERLEEISTTDAGAFEYVYNPTNGRVASVSNTVSGITTSYVYDLLDRTTNITYSASDGSLIRSLEYAYDAAGMITNKTIVDDASSFVSHDYQYDSIYRLVSEGQSNSASSVSSVVYNYDLAGNRTNTVVNGTTNTYTLGIGNRLVEATSPSLSRTFSYDDAGNTVGITNIESSVTNIQSLAWDERYRLKSVQSAQSVDVSYTYDVLNRRISRIEGTSTNFFVYDGNQIVADLDGAGNPLRTYAHGPGIDNILSMTVYSSDGGVASTNTYFYLKDHQNSVIALADETGTIVESYEYDAYGNTKVFNASGTELTESALGNRYTFQGREIDWSTGLMYFRARWYNPQTGRWLSKDPIGISGGLNQYVFVGNNPVNYFDPYGENAAVIVAGSSGAASGAAALAAGSVMLAGAVGYKAGQILDNAFGISDAIANAIVPPLERRGGQGKGERGQTHSADGTGNYWKHTRPDPNDPNQYLRRDSNGKWHPHKIPQDKGTPPWANGIPPISPKPGPEKNE